MFRRRKLHNTKMPMTPVIIATLADQVFNLLDDNIYKSLLRVATLSKKEFTGMKTLGVKHLGFQRVLFRY